MKRIIFVLSMLISVAYGQSVGYWRYDTVVIQKVGGNGELKIQNATRNVVGGVLTNMGNGRTAFVTPSVANLIPKSTFWVGSTGQSNEVASSIDCCTGKDTTSSPRLLAWDSTQGKFVRMVVGQEPLPTMAIHGFIAPSPAFYYGREMLNYYDTVKVVPIGLGAQAIDQWFDGTPKHMLLRFDSASIRARVPAYDVLLWIQGEADAATQPYLYRQRFKGTFDYLYSRPYFPSDRVKIVVAGMPRVWQGANPIGTGTIDSVLQEYGHGNNAFIGYANTDSATLGGPSAFGNQVHYNTAGIKTLGLTMVATANSLPRPYGELWQLFNNVIIDTTRKVVIGDTAATIGSTLDVKGNINVRSGFAYKLGGGKMLSGSTTNGNSFILNSGNGTTTGSNNSANGDLALAANTTGSNNVAISNNALLSNTTGNSNVAIGTGALSANTVEFENVAVGRDAMKDAAGAYLNVAIGARALQHSQNTNNTAVGANALAANLNAFQNSVFGANAGQNITSGSLNTFLGYNVGNSNTTQDYNTLIGIGAGSTTLSQHISLANGLKIKFETWGDDSVQIKNAFRRNSTRDKYLKIDTITGLLTWSDAATPTLQQVLTAGSSLNTDNTITTSSGNSLTFANAGSGAFLVTLDAAARLSAGAVASQMLSPNNNEKFSVSDAGHYALGLNAGTTNTRIVGIDSDDDQLGYITIGTGLSIPSGVLSSYGATAYAAKTSTYTITASDYTIEATSGTFTITLPTAVGISGRQYVITNSGSGVITLATTSSQTFVNVTATPTTLTLNQFNTVIVQSNGANWLRISSL